MQNEKLHGFLVKESAEYTSPLDFLVEAPVKNTLSKKEQDKISNLTPKEKATLETDKKKPYGQELILDIHDVPLDLFTSKIIKKFAKDLTKEIGMREGPEYSWGSIGDEGMYKPDGKGNEKKDGLSHIQFLWESSIVIHALDELQKVFINVFSCKEFDSDKAERFALKTFGGKLANKHNIVRK